jgi:arginine/lysine/ornithine decarboxylase
VLKPESAPLLDALLAHQESGALSLHVPGHKGGQALDAYGKPTFEVIMGIDYTEITGLDDLHHPSGAIREAQELAADCFGAEETFFLVGGSTAGNLALILSQCEAGGILIVQRNVHKSVLNGIALAGVHAVFLPGRVDEASGLATGVELAGVAAALERYPQASAVLVTNPNYYGMADHLGPLADLVHAAGKPLLVDEAHGAHFGFHPALPPSALSCGADAVVQSTHKMLSAMTMGAMLHIQGERLDRERLRYALAAIQSSSPSYPILASLDLSRRQMHIGGLAWVDTGLQAVQELRRKAVQYKALTVLERSETADYAALDPFKLSVRDRTGCLGGYQIQEWIEKHGCMVEMSDPRYALCVLSPASTQEDVQRLHRVLLQLDAQIEQRREETAGIPANITSAPSRSELSPPILLQPNWQASAQVRSTQSLVKPLSEVEGFYSAEQVIPYPPGIPVLFPGERITGEMRDYLLTLAHGGARFQGARDPKLATLLVTAGTD